MCMYVFTLFLSPGNAVGVSFFLSFSFTACRVRSFSTTGGWMDGRMDGRTDKEDFLMQVATQLVRVRAGVVAL